MALSSSVVLHSTGETRRPRSKKNHQQRSFPYRLQPQRVAVQAVWLTSQGLEAVTSLSTLAKQVLVVHSPSLEWLCVLLGLPPGGAALLLRLSGMAQSWLAVPLSGLGVVLEVSSVRGWACPRSKKNHQRLHPLRLPLRPRSKKNHQQRHQP